MKGGERGERVEGARAGAGVGSMHDPKTLSLIHLTHAPWLAGTARVLSGSGPVCPACSAAAPVSSSSGGRASEPACLPCPALPCPSLSCLPACRCRMPACRRTAAADAVPLMSLPRCCTAPLPLSRRVYIPPPMDIPSSASSCLRIYKPIRRMLLV